VHCGRALSEDEEAVEQVGVRVEESPLGPSAAPPAPFDDSGFRSFAPAGAQAVGEFRCADCGYGAVVHRALPPCPMCGGTVWESRGPLRP
jgi:rubrerythrin